MRSHLAPFATIFVFPFACGLLQGQAPNAKDPAELERLRSDYAKKSNDTTLPVTTWYQAQLEELQKKFIQSNNLEGALAVGKKLESVRLLALQASQGEFRKALLSTTWAWENIANGNIVEMTFKNDGTVSHIGMRGAWQISGIREVTISVAEGAKHVLRFDLHFNTYTETTGIVRGRRWK